MVNPPGRRSVLCGVAALTAAVLLAGCVPLTKTPSETGSPTTSSFLPCMVSNKDGYDDQSTNAQGLAGLMAAVKSLGVKEVHLQSDEQADYAPNVNLLLDDGCNLIIVVGSELRTAAFAAAKTNPKVNIVILADSADVNADGKADLPNLKPILSDRAQGAFLAGYVAASYSKSGIVATYGAAQTPPIVQTMDGFANGVAYYNLQKQAQVTVLGWDPASQEGSFVGRDDNGEKATAMAASLIEENADVLLPAEDPGGQDARGLGAAIAVIRSGENVALIGSRGDMAMADPVFSALYLTSITQDLTGGVEAAVKQAAYGSFDNVAYVGTLHSGGVGIAPFHDYEGKVDPALPSELDAIKAGIADGTIAVRTPPVTE